MSEELPSVNSGNEILHLVDGGIGRIVLNRPDALNALSYNMIRQLTHILLKWAVDPEIKAVVVTSEGGKAFCAGGDIRAAYEAKRQGLLDPLEGFFREEYALNTLIHEFPKPYIAILDGIAMGGGLGIAFNSPHSVVTDRSIIAMPESIIGFFPDVGATWFLSQCPNHLGLYWGMTGNRFTAEDALYAGLASTYVSSDKTSDLLSALRNATDTLATLDQFNKAPSQAPIQSLEDDIHNHFNKTSVAEIIDSLESTDSIFAQETLETLRSRSPTSVHVAFEQIQNVNPQASFRVRMQREFRMSQHFMKGHDFFEGVRAMLIDKDQSPQWKPSSLEDVTEARVKSYFSLLEVPDLEFIEFED